jgi:N-acetyltransferase
MFDLQPTLAGNLVSLRPLHADDFEALYAVAADPLIWEQHPANDRYKRDVFVAFFSEAMASGGGLIVFDAGSGAVIGSSRYNGYDAQNSEIEVGWTFLARSHWGGDANRELKRLMLNHAFGFVENVIFTIGPNNIRSQRAVQKLGAVLVGTVFNEQVNREAVVFRLTKSVFASMFL